MMITIDIKTVIGLSIFGGLILLLLVTKAIEPIEKWWRKRKQKP